MDPQIRAELNRIDELLQLLRGSGGTSTFGASTVVWRPTAASSGNVFGTWPEVVAAVAAMDGAVTISVDTTLGAAIIEASNWDLRPAPVSGPVEMVGGTPGSFAPFVTLGTALGGPAAITLHGLSGLTDIQLDNHSTVDVITTSPTYSVSFYLRGFASITQSIDAAGAAFFASVGGIIPLDLCIYMQDFTFIGTFDGGSNAIQVGAGQTQLCIEDQAILDTNMLLAPIGSVNVLVSSVPITFSGFQAYMPQAGAPTIVPFAFVQRGSTAIAPGTGKTAAIPAFISATSRINVTLKTPVGDAATVKYAALAADRVNGNPGSFQISALGAAGGGAVNGADTSTIDWEVFSA